MAAPFGSCHREAIHGRIELRQEKMSELNLLNIRRGIYTDIITHHQKTLLRIEKRMAEIHDEVEAIKKEVLAWENSKQAQLSTHHN